MIQQQKEKSHPTRPVYRSETAPATKVEVEDEKQIVRLLRHKIG